MTMSTANARTSAGGTERGTQTPAAAAKGPRSVIEISSPMLKSTMTSGATEQSTLNNGAEAAISISC